MKDYPFVIILSSDGGPDYFSPMEINARSKDEAYKLLSQDVPPETIHGVYTALEYQEILQKMISKRKTGTSNSNNYSQNAQSIQDSQYDTIEENGNDFLNKSIQQATQVAKNITLNNSKNTNTNNIVQQQNDVQIENIQSQNMQQQNVSTENIVPSTPKYFMDDGVQFKIENGILYKKMWENVSIEEYQNDAGQLIKPEFRIINKDTGKQIKSSKYIVQQLVWKQVQTQ